MLVIDICLLLGACHRVLSPVPLFSRGDSMKFLSLSQQWILFLLTLLILGLLYLRFGPALRSAPPEEVYNEFVVEVSGAVVNPGIHLFRYPPTIAEVIGRAGGFQERLPYDGTPLSEVLETGTLITVTREPSGTTRMTLGRMEAKRLLVFSIPLDLNRASVEDLCRVPGIGESLAQKIVAYRERRRGFRSIEELQHVSGVSEKKWMTLRSYFTVVQP